MSFDLMVYYDRSKTPSGPEWARGVVSEGFEVQLDPEVNLTLHSGFLPCNVGGRATGFEVVSHDVDDAERAELDIPGTVDVCTMFSMGSDEFALAEFSGAVASAVLAALTGGLLVDPQEGTSISGSQSVAWVKRRTAPVGGPASRRGPPISEPREGRAIATAMSVVKALMLVFLSAAVGFVGVLGILAGFATAREIWIVVVGVVALLIGLTGLYFAGRSLTRTLRAKKPAK